MNNLHSDEITEVVKALVKARGNFTAAVKDGKNPHFKSSYTTLDSAIDAITKAMTDQGIYVTQQTDIMGAQTVLYTRFLHTSGQWIGSAYPIHPVKSDPQGEGSALTYGRRYALMALAGIAPEDDDGNAAVKAVEKESAKDQEATQTWIDALTGAGSLDELERLGKELADAGLSASAKTKVRAAYSATKHRLSDKEAA